MEKGIGEECQVEEQEVVAQTRERVPFITKTGSRTTGQGHGICDGSEEEGENEDQEKSGPKERSTERARRHWHVSF